VFTPLAAVFGLAAPPPRYFLFLSATVILYMALITVVKRSYIKKHNELI